MKRILLCNLGAVALVVGTLMAVYGLGWCAEWLVEWWSPESRILAPRLVTGMLFGVILVGLCFLQQLLAQECRDYWKRREQM